MLALLLLAVPVPEVDPSGVWTWGGSAYVVVEADGAGAWRTEWRGLFGEVLWRGELRRAGATLFAEDYEGGGCWWSVTKSRVEVTYGVHGGGEIDALWR